MAKRKSNKAIWIVLALVVILIGVVSIFIINKSNGAIAVTTSKVERKTIVQTVSATGKIEPETEVKISSETSGEIIFLGVKEGDTVRANQLLVRIKPDIIEAQLEQMKAGSDASKSEIKARKAEVDKTKADFDRAKELFNKGFISKQDFDGATLAYNASVASYESSLSRLKQSQASQNQIERNMDRTSIYSPLNGIVTSLSVENNEKVVGSQMMTGTEMMKVADLRMMNAVVDVDENDIIHVKIGDTARVEIDALPDKIINGVVIEIGHSAKSNALGTQDQVTNFSVKIRLLDPEAKLRPGMSCNAEIETETRINVLSVPLQAVTIRDPRMEEANDEKDDRQIQKVDENENKSKKVERPPSVVFLKKDKKAKMVKVETGISDNGFIEILNGLNENDEIISGSFQAVSKLLKDGADIKIDSVAKKFKKK